MSCLTMLERMLDADRSELTGRGDSPLAVHVRECARCRAVAARLLRDTDELARAVERAGRPTLEKTSSRNARRATRILAPGDGSSARADARVAPGGGRMAPRRAVTLRRIALGSLAAGLATLAIGRWPHARVTPPALTVADVPAASPADSGTLAAASLAVVSHERSAVPPGHPKTSRNATGSSSGPDRLAGRAASRQYVPDRRLRPQPVAPQRLPAAAAERPVTIAAVRLAPDPRSPLGGSVAVDPPDGAQATIIRTSNPAVTVVWLRP